MNHFKFDFTSAAAGITAAIPAPMIGMIFSDQIASPNAVGESIAATPKITAAGAHAGSGFP